MTEQQAITEFLAARVGEDRQGVLGAGLGDARYGGTDLNANIRNQDRALREAHAKESIIEAHSCEWAERPERVIGETDDPFCSSCIGESYPCPTLRHLATVYSDHPDYREEWRR